MDFVTGLPISTDWNGTSYDSILVIVDRLTKMVHYKPVQITINVPGLAEVILDFVARHHGLPDSIVSDTLLAIKLIYNVFHVSLLKQDTTRKGWVCENATRTLLSITVSVLGMPDLRSTYLSGWWRRYKVIAAVTRAGWRFPWFMEFGYFLGFSDDVTAATSVLSSASTSISEVKTHCLRTSISFLLCVTFQSIKRFFVLRDST